MTESVASLTQPWAEKMRGKPFRRIEPDEFELERLGRKPEPALQTAGQALAHGAGRAHRDDEAEHRHDRGRDPLAHAIGVDGVFPELAEDADRDARDPLGVFLGGEEEHQRRRDQDEDDVQIGRARELAFRLGLAQSFLCRLFCFGALLGHFCLLRESAGA